MILLLGYAVLFFLGFVWFKWIVRQWRDASISEKIRIMKRKESQAEMINKFKEDHGKANKAAKTVEEFEQS